MKIRNRGFSETIGNHDKGLILNFKIKGFTIVLQ